MDAKSFWRYYHGLGAFSRKADAFSKKVGYDGVDTIPAKDFEAFLELFNEVFPQVHTMRDHYASLPAEIEGEDVGAFRGYGL